MKKLCLKKLGVVTLLATMFMFAGGFLPIVSHAQTASPIATNENMKLSHFQTTEGEVAVATSESGATSVSRATITLTGNLNSTKPLIGKPYATANSTTTKSVYSISAGLSVNNNGTGTSNVPTATLNNTTKVTTNKLTATTAKCTFTGKHSAKEKSNTASWSTKNTSVSW